MTDNTNDVQKILWKQNQEFKESLRGYGFLAENMAHTGAYDSERQRLDLVEISKVCLEAETGSMWQSVFRDKSSQVAHAALRKWWLDKHVLTRSIGALDAEFERFNIEVEQESRNRRAGALRPSLKSLIQQVLHEGS